MQIDFDEEISSGYEISRKVLETHADDGVDRTLPFWNGNGVKERNI